MNVQTPDAFQGKTELAFSNPKLQRLIERAKRDGDGTITLSQFFLTQPPVSQALILDSLEAAFVRSVCDGMDSGALTNEQSRALADDYAGRAFA